MKDVIYLVCNKDKVESMRKSLPTLKRGEFPIKVNIEVNTENMRPPVLEKTIYVEDWRQGIDLEDVEFNQHIITKEEAEIIRQRRIEKMKQILEGQGYTVAQLEDGQE